MGFTLQRTASGKLAEHIAADATSPFSTGDWDQLTGIASVSVTSSGALNYNYSASAGNWSGLLYNQIAARGAGMVEALLTRVNADSTNNDAGIAFHYGDEQNHKRATLEFTDNLSTGDFRLIEESSNTEVASTEVSGSNYNQGTFHWLALGVDGLDARAYSDTDSAALTLSSSEATERTTGQFGLISRRANSGTQNSRVREIYMHASDAVTCTDMLSGYKLKVLNSTDGVLGSATESGGTATVPFSSIGRRNSPLIVIVTDANDNEQARLTADSTTGVWAGDAFKLVYATSAVAGRRGVVFLTGEGATRLSIWYPIVTGDYWTGMASTDTDQRFDVTGHYITGLSTSGVPGNVSGDYVVGVGTNKIAEVTEFNFRQSFEEVSANYMGQKWEERLPGVSSWDGEARYLFVPGEATQKDVFDLLVDGTQAAFEFYTTGSSSDGYYSGNGYVQDWRVAHPLDQAAAADVSFVGTGTLTRTSSST